MNLIKNLIIKYKELIIYGICGVGTTIVNFLAYKIFNIILGDNLYLVSNVIAWFICIIFAYVTNKLFVFESKSWEPKLVLNESTSFLVSRIFSFIIEEAGLFALVDLLGMKDMDVTVMSITISGDMIAKAVIGVVVIVINYVFSKLVIFRKKN